MPTSSDGDADGIDQWNECPDSDCPNCGARDWTPLWYGFGGREDYRGVTCGNCHANLIRSREDSTEIAAVEDSEVIPHGE